MGKRDYRSYIKTRTSLGEIPTAIHQDLVTVYGPKPISYSTVLVTETTTESIEPVQGIIEEDPHSTYCCEWSFG